MNPAAPILKTRVLQVARRVVTSCTKPTFALPPMLHLPLIIVTAFTVFTVVTRVIAGFIPTPPNPFAVYADVFPGQSRAALADHGFVCPPRVSGSYGAPAYASCEAWPTTGLFSQVRVTLAQDVIRQIDFVLRGTTLRVGDLITLWGSPHIVGARNVQYYYWTGGAIQASALTVSQRHRLLSPLNQVSIVQSGWPVEYPGR
jgi:hypothetical protein